MRMRLGGRELKNSICGATKKRTGEPCRNKPMENGKCRLHGGLSTGPKDKEKHSESLKGNKNALSTGEHESISYDTMSEDEKELLDHIPEDPYKNANGRLKVLEIRFRRIMKRYEDELNKKNPDESKILSLEEVLLRNDSKAAEFIRLKKELSTGDTEKDEGSVGDLVAIIGKARGIRIENGIAVEIENAENG